MAATFTTNSTRAIDLTDTGKPIPLPLAVRFYMTFSGGSSRLRPRKTELTFKLCALAATIALSMTFGCANPHAILIFAAPSTATAGVPFTVMLTVTINGQRDTVINSYIKFASSDPAAVLPAIYYFTPQDAGSHTWSNGFILMTPGSQTISGSIFDASGINGTANVTVSP